ncbi:MAG: hypothetical protein MUO88_05430 [Desulfobacterales bacterium]|nr:hypothetical protein [Desulfobacterales bacterium]
MKYLKISLVFSMIILLVAIGSAFATPPDLPDGRQGAEPPDTADFFYDQHYPDWGPALYYGQDVRIIYNGINWWIFKDGRFRLAIQGVAKVYAGDSTDPADLIDTRPFYNTEMWYEPENTWGWPVSWYTCGVKILEYNWSILGVYDYTLTAMNGVWNLKITAFTSPPTFTEYEVFTCPPE